ncbi:putative Ig domain-containing protein [Thalassotalea nanhaiensis]|uniref:non-specific serine/threonine protein kinase n=1 Tax=Thalassotalea nanhaiensis TaxID=3065648 RepID=A0ABY9TEY7_9GAMM|nr:putative Ig domain-containing protein [Colwelliaceae bacterium SQ345]
MSKTMNKSYLALLVATTLGLTACGGGGGGGGTKVETPNTAPTISGTPTVSVNENQAYSFTPSASDSNNDSLTFSITNKPNWASFDTSTGALTGTPDYDAADIYAAVSISVSDGKDSVNLAPFDINVINVNRAPIIEAIEDQSVSETSEFSYSLSASDADQQDLTFTVENAPTWLTLNTDTNVLSGTPTLSDAGTNVVTVSVSDGETTTSKDFNLSILNSVQVSGKVIDGYISGADVYLDLNNDGIRNTNEEFVTTDTNGSYSFVVKGENLNVLQTKFLRAYVGNGASDASRPELDFAVNPVTFSYAPMANIDSSTDAVVANITPFTHSVSEEVAAAITSDATLAEIQAALTSAETKILSELLSALSIDDTHQDITQIKAALLSDFIASGLSSEIVDAMIAKAKDMTNLAMAMQSSIDTDEDGFSDLYETYFGSDPQNNASTPNDLDGDGHTNDEEIAAGSDPQDPLSTLDDLDGDGYSNAEEEFYGTDPRDKNSNPGDLDADGVPNGGDAFPNDANEHSDIDGDGIGDNADLDRDGNGFNDADETKIIAGRNFKCAINLDKTVSCDLTSDSTFAQNDIPAELANVELLAAGGAHVCAVSSDANDTAICWGDNQYKQLDVTPAGGKIVQLVLGDNYTCTVAEDGDELKGYTVQCFGALTNREGDFEERNGSFALVAGGPNHICANSTVVENGIARGVPYCLANDEGVVLETSSAGYGNNTLQVTGFSLGKDFTCTYTNEQSSTCIGSLTTLAIDGVVLTQVSAGDTHVCAIEMVDELTNQVHCWGDNTFGQLEIGSVLDGQSIDRIHASGNTTCAFVKDNAQDPICWGASTEFNATSIDYPVSYMTGGDLFKCAVLSDGSEICDGTIDADTNDDGVTDLFDGSDFIPAPNAQVPGYSICMGVKATDKLACLTPAGLEYSTVMIKGETKQLSANAIVDNGLTGMGDQGGICVLDNGEVNCVSGIMASDTPYTSSNPVEMGVGKFTVCFIDDEGLQCINKHTQISSSLVDNMPDFSEAVGFKSLQVHQDTTQEYACVAAGYVNSQDKVYYKAQCWGSAEQGQLEARTNSLSKGFQRFELNSVNACLIASSLIECWGNTENGIGSINTATIEQQELGINTYNPINAEEVMVDDELKTINVKVSDVSLNFKTLCYISDSGLNCVGTDPALPASTLPSNIEIGGADTCLVDGINVLVDNDATMGGTNIECSNSDFGAITNIFDVDASAIATCVFTDDKTVCKSTVPNYEFDGEVSAPIEP